MSRAERVAAAREAMFSQESAVVSANPVDILSGSDEDAVAFTSAWETEN
jgi:hypothetical protein